LAKINSGNSLVIAEVRAWLSGFVIELNLCPFAKKELLNERIRFVSSEATTVGKVLSELKAELNLLQARPEIETTLLILPSVFPDFYDFNDFLVEANRLIEELDLLGVYQIASFHPQYQFANTHINDAENYTNRAPYPILHLLRENSLEAAIASYPNSEHIPERNIALMKEMGEDKIKTLLEGLEN